MANISTSVDETFIVWWTDFMIILCFLQIWEIEVVMLFLTLASNMINTMLELLDEFLVYILKIVEIGSPCFNIFIFHYIKEKMTRKDIY